MNTLMILNERNLVLAVVYDFMKGRVGFEFIVQLLLINSLKPLKI